MIFDTVGVAGQFFVSFVLPLFLFKIVEMIVSGCDSFLLILSMIQVVWENWVNYLYTFCRCSIMLLKFILHI